MQLYYGDRPYIIPSGRHRRGKSGKKRRVRAPIVLLALFLVLSFAVLFAASASGDKVTVPAASWYFLVFYTETTSVAAEVSAKSVREAGGAGFIVNDGSFRVVAAVYSSERDARSVEARQTLDCFVLTVAAKKVNLGAESEDTARLKEALTLHESAFSRLSAAVAEAERGEITESELLLRTEEESRGFSAAQAGLVGAAASGTAAVVSDYLLAAENALLLAVTGENDTAAVRVRHALCEVIYRRCTLAVGGS